MDQALNGGNPLAIHFAARDLAIHENLADSMAMYDRYLRLDPYDMDGQLEAYVVRVRAGQPDKATSELTEAMAKFKWPPWPAPVTDYFLGRISFEDLMHEAQKDEGLAKRRQCQAYGYVGSLRTALGQSAQSAEMLDKAKAECSNTPAG